MWAFETVFRRGQTAAIDVELGRLPPLAGATTNDACVDIIAAAAAGEIEPTVEIVSPAFYLFMSLFQFFIIFMSFVKYFMRYVNGLAFCQG